MSLIETFELMLEIAEITDNINSDEKAGDITPEQAQEARAALVTDAS